MFNVPFCLICQKQLGVLNFGLSRGFVIEIGPCCTEFSEKSIKPTDIDRFIAHCCLIRVKYVGNLKGE